MVNPVLEDNIPMKRILALILALATVLSLFACAEDKYPPVESTEEEARVVLKLNVEGKEYDVKYELYRALFLNNKSRVDLGDSSVWSSADKQKYIDAINEIIIGDLSEIYAVLHLASELGFNAFSSEADERVKEYVIGAVEGDENQLGHGSYEKYLESLKKNNLNYSAAALMMRYAMAEEAIIKYYRGEIDPVKGQLDGGYEYTREDVENYYYSDNCRRILQAYFQTGVKSAKEIDDYRTHLATLDGDMAIAAYIIGSTMATESDLIRDGKVSGITVGISELYAEEYSEYVNAIFYTEAGRLSKAVQVENSAADGYYIIYGLEKSAEHFEDSYLDIRNSYLDNVSGNVLKNVITALSEGVSYTDGYASIDHSSISMN